jgi:hypothetical protein
MVIGGSGVKDDVPAYLSRGEYVIKRAAVGKYGKEFFDSLNQSSVVQAAAGGSTDKHLEQIQAAETSARRRNADIAKAGLESYSFKFKDPDVKKKDWLGRELSESVMREGTGYRLNLSQSITPERIDAIRAVADKYPDVAKHIDRDILDQSTLEIGDGKNKIHLKNKFVYDDAKRPGAGKYLTDSRLSNFALTDENNPQNRYKFEKAENFWNYQKERMEFLKSQKEQMDEWEQGKKAKRTSFLFGAAAMLFSGAAMGKFARGGRTEDDIPALLTGGEYVVRKGIVDKYGLQFFENLNRGRINTFNRGGYVSPGSITGDIGARSDNINPYGPEEKRESYGSAETTNNISITVNVGDSGNVSAGVREEGTSTDVSTEEGKALGERVKSAVIDVIVKEKRPGGLLYE